jgi:uncharacterized surface protein with fasciclin (FAS1) repeats
MKRNLLLILMFFMSIFANAQKISDIVANSPNHNTLEAAISAAGLTTALSGTNELTLFAPTDAAFAALPEGTVQALLADPQGELTKILLYHALQGEVVSSVLSNGQFTKTLNGKSASIKILNGEAFINNAKISVTDIQADNGVVHVIDAVILPPKTVVDIAVNSPIHTTLVAAASAAGLVPVLQGAGPFTIFAPTDAAFAALPAGTIEALLADPTGDLTKILTYHAVGGNVLSSSLSNGQIITTVQGGTAKITINDEGVFINNAKVTVADIIADNGVVHVIDAVLLNSVNTEDAQFEESAVQIFPNPSRGEINITANENADIEASVLDINGSLISKLIGKGKIESTINTKPGIYFINVEIGGKLLTRKIIKY